MTYRDDAGRVADSYSLSRTYITNLARAGVYPSKPRAWRGTAISA